jgi:hypothetical protein
MARRAWLKKIFFINKKLNKIKQNKIKKKIKYC